METVAVDHVRRNDANGDTRRAAGDGAEQLLPLLRRQLLRVVQPPERPHPVVAQALVVEEHGRDDERSREAPPPGLVGTRDVAHAEPAVEGEQFLAGPPHLLEEDTP